MPNPWYPGAVRDDGAAAGYTRGHNRMNSVKCHYTVGRDSWALIRNEGLAQWLVTRDGTVAQYAEADSLCYDSGEWNDDGPGIEIEFLDEPEGIFTDAARDATAGLIHWLSDEWGMPLDYYDGERLPEGTWHGFIAHGSLQQSSPHTDYWPRADWDRMVTGGEGDDVKALIIKNRSAPFLYVFVNGYKYPTANREHVDLMYFFGQSSNGADNPAELSDEQFNAIPDLSELV